MIKSYIEHLLFLIDFIESPKERRVEVVWEENGYICSYIEVQVLTYVSSEKRPFDFWH